MFCNNILGVADAVLNPWENGRILFHRAHWICTQEQNISVFPIYPGRNNTKLINTITVHSEFLEVLQSFFMLHRNMLKIQK
jgi:hypothetical protein